MQVIDLTRKWYQSVLLLIRERGTGAWASPSSVARKAQGSNVRPASQTPASRHSESDNPCWRGGGHSASGRHACTGNNSTRCRVEGQSAEHCTTFSDW